MPEGYMKLLCSITDRDIDGSEGRSLAAPIKGVSVIVYDSDSKIALIHVEALGFYELPGGGVNDHETLEAALLRELREETGCICQIIANLGMSFESRIRDDIAMERYYYWAKVVGNKGDLQLEEKENAMKMTLGWYHLDDALASVSLPIKNGYRRLYTQKRDLAALNEALHQIQAGVIRL